MSTKKNTGLTRRASGLMALEPRFMFDGAAVAEASHVLAPSAPEVSVLDLSTDRAPVALSTSDLSVATEVNPSDSSSQSSDSAENIFVFGSALPDVNGNLQQAIELAQKVGKGLFG